MNDLLKNQCIFLGTIPKLNELICMTLSIDQNERKDNSIKSDFHWQILKCRILIFSASNILASPVSNSITQIYVVLNKNINETTFFQDMVINNKLKILKQSHVTPHVFEACLKYTLLAKLAPKWNIVDSFLVEGRDFLIRQEPLNGVKYNITVNGSEIIISVCAVKVRLNTVSSYNFVDNKYTEEAEKHELWHEDHWIKVLPSMKRGRIVSVSKTFPKLTCFKDYRELRRHWKNIHGYRLPEDDKEIIYLGIHFFGSTVFTYPIYCVRSSLSLLPLRQNYYETFYRFISDLRGVFCNICDVPFHINNEFGYASSQLLKINNLLDTRQPNLIHEAPSIRSFQDNRNFFSTNQSVYNDELFPTQAFSTQDDDSTQNVSLCTPSQIPNESKTDERFIPKIPIIPSFIGRKSVACQNLPKKTSSPNVTQNVLEIKKIPESQRFFQNLMKPIKPTFIKPKKVNMFEVLKNKQFNTNTINQNNNEATFASNDTNPFKNYNTGNFVEEALKDANTFHSDSNFKTKITPTFQNKVKNSKANIELNFKKYTITSKAKEENLSVESRENSNIFSDTGCFKLKKSPIFQNKVQNSVNSVVPNFKNCIKVKDENLLEKSKSNSKSSLFSTEGNFKIPPTPIFHGKTSNTVNINMSNMKKSTKRKEESFSENKIKKSRIKQPNTCDIKQMAFSGTLAKANMPSLMEFLKMNNITYKSKDKKADLINKVLNHFNLSIIKLTEV